MKVVLIILLMAGISYAHFGGVDDEGGHMCFKNCKQYQLRKGQYHLHKQGTWEPVTDNIPLYTPPPDKQTNKAKAEQLEEPQVKSSEVYKSAELFEELKVKSSEIYKSAEPTEEPQVKSIEVYSSYDHWKILFKSLITTLILTGITFVTFNKLAFRQNKPPFKERLSRFSAWISGKKTISQKKDEIKRLESQKSKLDDLKGVKRVLFVIYYSLVDGMHALYYMGWVVGSIISLIFFVQSRSFFAPMINKALSYVT